LSLFFIRNKKVLRYKSEVETIEIKLKGETFLAEIAAGQKEKEKGLSGKENLCERCAMLLS